MDVATGAIAVEGVSFAWPNGQQVLTGCTFGIPPGQFWMLLGANGSGKSTLLKILSGLLVPQQGTTHIAGKLGFVFQNPDRQLVMPTVGADIAFGLVEEGLTRNEAAARVATALAAVNLPGLERRPIYALSGGQKQRVAIAGALASRASVLLLDEPTALLDRENQGDLVAMTAQLVREQSLTALWVTHRLDELLQADGAILLERGRVTDSGDPKRLYTKIRGER
ncbi:MAG: ABC transporter ATP-binding protein [Oscillatoriales cyanobacterium SM2_1_8]|nr:ABC transporter ATP-binding protein [Oscillatoriales cyanobacterium SM2_1_8]